MLLAKSVFALCLCVIWSLPTAQGQCRAGNKIAMGTVWGREGGLVASASGVIHLAVREALLHLHFSAGPSYGLKDDAHSFRRADSESIGAIWKVWYHCSRDSGAPELYLDRAVYMGRHDPELTAADHVVREFFHLLAGGMPSHAYDLLAPSLKDRLVPVQSDATRGRNFGAYLRQGANATCTSIIGREKTQISLEVEVGCFDANSISTGHFTVSLVQGTWRIVAADFK
jgi:hypothetical protein